MFRTCFGHSGTFSKIQTFARDYVVVHLFDPRGGARGHYGDTLGESPRLKLVCDFYIIVLASVQHPNLCVSEGQRFVFSIES